MLLWMILTVICSAAAVLVAAPFLRRLDAPRTPGDIDVYRDQLAEVDREVEAGVLPETEAAPIRLEIKRRILAANDGQGQAIRRYSEFEYNIAAVAVTGLVVLGSVLLYGQMGRPETPPAAHARWDADQPAAAGPLDPDAASSQAGAQGDSAGPSVGPSVGTVDDMIAQLEARLEKSPDDVRGWQMLGWSYLNTSRYEDAARAYAKAIALDPKSPELRTAHGEALVRAAADVVTPEALAAFESAVALDPKDARARYFKGLAKHQSGKTAEAVADWIGILNDTDPSEPWWSELRQQTADTAQTSGIATPDLPQGPEPTRPSTSATGSDATAPSPAAALPAPPAAAPAPGRGPTAADMAEGEAMPPAARDAMIRKMVDGLATRLKASPRDRDGWIKLMRSYSVLGEAAKARSALDAALAAFSDSETDRQALAAAARDLGIGE